MRSYYSQRAGTNPNPNGLPLVDITGLFLRVYEGLCEEGYFAEAFGFECVDAGHVNGKIRDVELTIMLAVRKKDLWPIHTNVSHYSEDDLFDMIEFLFQQVSKPTKGTYHSWSECGMHWETFNQAEGRREFRGRINVVLGHYANKFELSPKGDVLSGPEAGFEPIFKADVPSKDSNVINRINAAVLAFRKHAATLDDRRQAVRDLADILEYLRPKIQKVLPTKDEADLFNIANNFGIRHHNEKQKTDYDAALWLSWMFYFYLSTIHVVLRKMKHDGR
jgi:hypothetical protein